MFKTIHLKTSLAFSNYQLNAQFLYSSTICMLHYDSQHVSSSTLLILRTNCITTASGIVTMETLISTLLYIYPCNVNSDDFIFLLFNDLSREHLTTLDITEGTV